MSKPKVVSLCCGAGIGEVGFSSHWDTLLAADNWFRALCSFNANFPGIKTTLGDISDAKMIRWAADAVGRVDGLFASTPCPSFSRANSGGHAAKAMDPRSEIYLAPLKWVEALRPAFFVSENVDSIKTSPYLGLAIGRLKVLGYKTTCWVLDAADYGTPQHRARLFLVATRGKKPTPPRPTHGRGKGLKPYVTIGQAIGGLSEEEALSMGCESLSPVRKWIMQAVPPGRNWRALTGERLEMAMRYARGSQLCRRYSADDVAATLLTGPSCLGVTAPLHPGTLTSEEFTRLNGDAPCHTLTAWPKGHRNPNIHPGGKLDYRQFARYAPEDVADTVTVQRENFKRLPPGMKIDEREFARYSEGDVAKTLTGKTRQKWDRLHPGMSNEVYARLSDQNSSPTLPAGGPVRQRRVLTHPLITRPLSVLEFLKLQGVEKPFVLCGSRGDRYRQAGNGISVQLAEAVARAVVDVV